MKMFSVAYVSSFIAKQMHCVVNCDAYKAYLTSQAVLLLIAFMYLKEYTDIKQSLTFHSEKFVTLLENMMAEVAHLSSVKQHITAAIKNTVDFDWIRSTGCSLHPQESIDNIVSGVTEISIP
jgi:hypothetical protein